jgi:hypothetical protein
MCAVFCKNTKLVDHMRSCDGFQLVLLCYSLSRVLVCCACGDLCYLLHMHVWTYKSKINAKQDSNR